MSSRTVYVSTDVAGAFAWERALYGVVRGIAVELGTLETPDILVTDDVHGTILLDLTAAAVDDVFTPGVPLTDADGTEIVGGYAPATVMGRVRVEVTGGGASKAGRIHLLLET